MGYRYKPCSVSSPGPPRAALAFHDEPVVPVKEFEEVHFGGSERFFRWIDERVAQHQSHRVSPGVQVPWGLRLRPFRQMGRHWGRWVLHLVRTSFHTFWE